MGAGGIETGVDDGEVGGEVVFDGFGPAKEGDRGREAQVEGALLEPKVPVGGAVGGVVERFVGVQHYNNVVM